MKTLHVNDISEKLGFIIDYYKYKYSLVFKSFNIENKEVYIALPYGFSDEECGNIVKEFRETLTNELNLKLKVRYRKEQII